MTNIVGAPWLPTGGGGGGGLGEKWRGESMRGKVSDIARTVFITIIIIIIIIVIISIDCAQCPCYNYVHDTTYLVSNCCRRRHSICGIK